jgi:hypothetical protein
MASFGALDSESVEKKDQRQFVRNQAPYLKLAKALGQEDIFLDRLFTLWFIRWPLRLNDLDSDQDFLDHNKARVKKVRYEIFKLNRC